MRGEEKNGKKEREAARVTPPSNDPHVLPNTEAPGVPQVELL